jgi:cytochrome c oxidase subunit I
MPETLAPPAPPPQTYLEHRDHRGIFRWILSTDHKRIGILYLTTMLGFFLVGITLAFLIRLELLKPGSTIVSGRTYNTFFSLHGLTMVFLFVIPGLSASFGNFFLPLHIGARDVAFPRLNLLSWWLFLTGGLMVYASNLFAPGMLDTGWTLYVPYSITTNANVSLAVFGVFVIGFSSILSGLNFVTTVHRMRAPGMTWGRLPLFTWAVYTTGWIQMLATPILGITLALIAAERLVGIGVFDPVRGGDPLTFQHMFWIYSHPAVYIMILPAFGAISEIVPVFSQRRLYGYWFLVASTAGIALIGYLVWGHHMFTSGMSDSGRFVFSLLTFLVAVPTGIKIFNWTSTLYKGSIRLEAPLLYALAFIFLFSIGGLSGLVQGAVAADIHLHDTYYIVAHFHYVMLGGTGFAFFGALHYWWPKMTGRMYFRRPAFIAWLLLFAGFNTVFFPKFILGFQGMPRRYFDYLPQYAGLQMLSTIGSWVLIAGVLLMLGSLVVSLRRGARATSNPWGAATLEWTTSSPPPPENYRELPDVKHGPYEIGPDVEKEEEARAAEPSPPPSEKS